MTSPTTRGGIEPGLALRRQGRTTSARPWKICRHALSRVVYAACLAVSFAVSAHATPQKAAAFYEDALKKYERNEFRAAAVQLKNAVQHDSRMLAAHELLGKALLQSGDLNGADAAFEEALKLGLDRNAIALPLAQLYLALGRADLVIERISTAGLSQRVKVEVLALRGTAFGELGKPNQASESFQEARLVDPKSVTPYIAEITYLLTAGKHDRAKPLSATAIEIAPGNEHAWNMRAAVLHATSDLQGALEAYDRALSIEPRHVDARLARASVLIDLNRDPAAEKDLDVLRRSAPEEPRAAYMRAVIASRKGDERASVEALTEVAKLIDALAPAWLAGREQLLMLGALASHGLGHLEKARGYLNHILVRNSRNLGARKLFASICIDLKDYSRALSELESLHKAAPEDPQVLYMLGTVHMIQRRYLQATQLLEKAAARTGSPEMNRALGLSQLEVGRTELGLATLEKVYAADPRDARTGTALATLHMRRGQPQKAVQIAEDIVKVDPANLTALNFLGIIRAAMGDTAGARRAYAQVVQKDPGFGPAVINLARLEIVEGRFDDARRRLSGLLAKQQDVSDVLLELGLLEQGAGNVAEAARHLLRASQLQRRDARPGVALVELYVRQRRFDQALATAKELASSYPNDVGAQLALGNVHALGGDTKSAYSVYQNATTMAGLDAETQVRIARVQLAAGNPNGAYENAQKALQAWPDYLAALAVMVEIERQRGGARRAEAALNLLITKHGDTPETAVVTGDLAFALQRYSAAYAAYRRAWTRQQTTPNALNVARAILAAGQAGKANAFLEDWSKKRPNDIQALRALAEMQFRTGQLSEARQNYERVIAAAPNDAATLNNYANLLLMLKDPAAQGHAERAVKLTPGNPSYADTLGWILAQKGEIVPALLYLREARLRSPENGQIRFHLAFALAKAARPAEAKEELAAALGARHRPESTEELIRLRKQLEL